MFSRIEKKTNNKLFIPFWTVYKLEHCHFNVISSNKRKAGPSLIWREKKEMRTKEISFFIVIACCLFIKSKMCISKNFCFDFQIKHTKSTICTRMNLLLSFLFVFRWNQLNWFLKRCRFSFFIFFPFVFKIELNSVSIVSFFEDLFLRLS